MSDMKMCVECKAVPAKENRVRCPDCLARKAAHAREYYRKHGPSPRKPDACLGGRCTRPPEPGFKNCTYHRQKAREDTRAWKERQDQEELRAQWRASARRAKYGLTDDQIAEMTEAQGNVCAICSQPEATTRKGRPQALSIDHCHETGLVRGLLCNRCNRAIGLMGDDPGILMAAAAYLLQQTDLLLRYDK